MKYKKPTLIIFTLLFAFAAYADVFDTIAEAFKAGNAKEAAKYFDTSIELKTIDKSSVYSRAQAEVVLKEFFDKHPVKSFKVIHRGSSAKGAQYAIGDLQTEKGNFRTYIYIKVIQSKTFIQELSIEAE